MKGLPHPHAIPKAGQITTNGSGVASVVFKKSLRSPGYAISLACKVPADTVIAMWDNKLRTGFAIKTENDRGQNAGNVVVDWVVTLYTE